MERAVTHLKTIAAAAFSASIAVFASFPASAGEQSTGAAAQQTAVAACLGINAYGPAESVQAAPDGMGDWIVWVRDKDSDLWMCNASADGSVYANALIQGDLLTGAGEQTIALVPAAARMNTTEASARAERLCSAVGYLIDDVTVVTTVSDGVGDYVVWLKGSNDSYWMCNASADSKLYVFEQVQYPINQGAGASAPAPGRIA
jgi:hypothetical protein